MKRIIAMVLCLVMVVGIMPVMAQDTKAMEAALIAVKGKIDVPAELTEFESSGHVFDGKTTYNFSWYDKERIVSLDINCDDKGRISSYHYYTDEMYRSSESNVLATVTKEQVIGFADSFVAKLLPETNRGETDVLMCDTQNVRANVSEMGTRYYIPYQRTYTEKHVPVDGNVANVNVLAVGDSMVVTNAYCNYDYDTPYNKKVDLFDMSDYKAAYQKVFPEELVYAKYHDDKGEAYTKLVYRFKDGKAGYMNYMSYEAVEKDEYTDGEIYKESMAEDAVAMNSAAGGLTREEIAELDKVAGLKAAEEIEKALRKLTQLKVTNEMTVQSTNVYKTDEVYYMYINLRSEDGRRLSATVDAKTGEIKDIYNYDKQDMDKEATDLQKKAAEQEMDEFAKKVGGEDFALCRGKEVEVSGMTASKVYVRYANDVPVIGEEITVSYDIENKRIGAYSNYIDNSLTFEAADGLVANPYACLIKAAPIEHIYIKSEEAYVLCYSANAKQHVHIDAHTGELFDPYAEEDNKAEYTDISDHWCKAAVDKLTEVGIRLHGDAFNPESAITQEDLLRIFAAGFNYTYFMSTSTDALYRELYNMGILTRAERNEKATVKREDAFVYMIRFAQLERVARINKIFTIDFKDKSAITPEKLGHTAILWGMGIIGGDDVGVRPQENITRAEAVVMLYKYLTGVK